MNGELAEGVVPDLLREIYVGRRSGILTLSRGDERAEPALPPRPHRQRPDQRGRGAARRDARAPGAALRGRPRPRHRDRGAGEAAARRGARASSGSSTPTGLEDAVAAHVHETLARVFTWPDGTYAFEEEPEDEAAGELTLKLSTGDLILEAVRAVRDPDVVRYALGDMDRVLVALERPAAALPEAHPVPGGRLRAVARGRRGERARDRADDPAAGRGDAEEPPRPALDRGRRVRRGDARRSPRGRSAPCPPPAAPAPRALPPPPEPRPGLGAPAADARGRRPPEPRRREGRRAAARDPGGVGGTRTREPLRGAGPRACGRRGRGEGGVLPPRQALPPGRRTTAPRSATCATSSRPSSSGWARRTTCCATRQARATTRSGSGGSSRARRERRRRRRRRPPSRAPPREPEEEARDRRGGRLRAPAKLLEQATPSRRSRTSRSTSGYCDAIQLLEPVVEIAAGQVAPARAACCSPAATSKNPKWAKRAEEMLLAATPREPEGARSRGRSSAAIYAGQRAADAGAQHVPQGRSS